MTEALWGWVSNQPLCWAYMARLLFDSSTVLLQLQMQVYRPWLQDCAGQSPHLSFGADCLGQPERKVATATAHIQHILSQLRSAPLHSHPLPDAVLPQAERVIELAQAETQVTGCSSGTYQSTNW